MVVKFHNAGYHHGDLKWSNILWSEKEPRGIYLTDPNNVRKLNIPLSQGIDFARYVLSAAEHSLPQSFRQQLVERYLEGRNSKSRIMARGLQWQLSKKEATYEGRKLLKSSELKR